MTTVSGGSRSRLVLKAGTLYSEAPHDRTGNYAKLTSRSDT
jgi:hypothetical protein